MSVEVYTLAEVADLVKMSPDSVARLWRQGKFPAPIDQSLSTRLHRWSSVAVDAYRAGSWERGAA